MVDNGSTPVPGAEVRPEAGASAPDRWRGVVVAGVALGSFCVLLLACWIVAGERIDGYRDDLADWAEGDRQLLLAAADPLDPATFPVGEDVDLTSPETLDRQLAACSALVDRRRDVLRAVEAVPEVASGALGVVRPELRRLAATSRERRASVEEYGAKAADAIAQTATDCAWSARVNARAARAQRYWQQQGRYEDPYATEGAIQCRDKAGCVPSDLERRDTYVELAGKALDERAAVAELQADDACEETSYGEGCVDLASSTAVEVKAWRAWYSWLSSTTAEADIPGFAERSETRDALVRDAAQRARAALRLRFAEADLRYAAEEPRWAEGFFTDRAERRLAALQPLAAPLLALG